MLPPHELKIKKFAKTFHGYSPEEVDDQIAFILEQYSALYRENDELERKLKLAQAKIDSYKGDEESIRSALVGAQKAGGKIVREANERAEILTLATKETCDRMISETAMQIRRQHRLLEQLRAEAAAFKETLLAQYAAQKTLIEQTADSERDTDLTEFADEEVVRSIVAGIKDEVARMSEENSIKLPGKKKRVGTIWKNTAQQSSAEPAAMEDKKAKSPAAAAEPVPALPEKSVSEAKTPEPEESREPAAPVVSQAETPSGEDRESAAPEEV